MLFFNMHNFSLWLKVNLTICLIFYGALLVSSRATPQNPERAIEPRAVIEGQPPPCVRNICPLGATQTTPGLKDTVAANKSQTITKSTDPKTRQSEPVKEIKSRAIGEGQPPPPCVRNICPLGVTENSRGSKKVVADKKSDTVTKRTIPTRQTAPVKCGDTGLPPPCGDAKSTNKTQPTIPKTHQTAPVTCGDTGLPPPCGDTKSTNKTQSTLPKTHQTAPVKCGDTGLPPPCGDAKSADKNQSTIPKTHQTAPVTCGDTGLPPPCGSKRSTKKN